MKKIFVVILSIILIILLCGASCSNNQRPIKIEGLPDFGATINVFGFEFERGERHIYYCCDEYANNFHTFFAREDSYTGVVVDTEYTEYIATLTYRGDQEGIDVYAAAIHVKPREEVVETIISEPEDNPDTGAPSDLTMEE